VFRWPLVESRLRRVLSSQFRLGLSRIPIESGVDSQRRPESVHSRAIKTGVAAGREGIGFAEKTNQHLLPSSRT